MARLAPAASAPFRTVLRFISRSLFPVSSECERDLALLARRTLGLKADDDTLPRFLCRDKRFSGSERLDGARELLLQLEDFARFRELDDLRRALPALLDLQLVLGF